MGSLRLKSDVARAIGFLGALGLIVLIGRVALLGEDVSAVVEYAGNAGQNTVDKRRMVERYYDALVPADTLAPVDAVVLPEVADRAPRRGEGRRLGRRAGRNPAQKMLENISRMKERYRSHEFLIRDLIPNYSGQMPTGDTFTINRWGMRDRDYETQKPERTFRMALLGGSNSMGMGVRYEETYATIVEQRLNEERPGEAYDAYEILNFSVTGYHMPSRLWVMENRVEAFAPDLILLVILDFDQNSVHSTLAKRLYAKPSFEALHFDFYKRAVSEAGITASDFGDYFVMAQKLHGHCEELLSAGLTRAAEFSKRTDIPVFGLVLNVSYGESRRQSQVADELAEMAKRAGLPVLIVFDALSELTAEEAYLNSSNRHPSALAHRLIAEKLHDRMMGHDLTRGMLLSEPPDQREGAP